MLEKRRIFCLGLYNVLNIYDADDENKINYMAYYT